MLKASILKDTNKLISSTEIPLQNVRIGSYVIFDEDNVVYTVARVEKLNFVKDFEVLNESLIRVNGNIQPEIMLNDSIVITYKEYELQEIISIYNGGSGYKVDDILEIEGGILSHNLVDDLCYAAKVKVSKVDEYGEIQGLDFVDNGKYLEINSDNNLYKLNGGLGTKCELNLKFGVSSNRSKTEKNIVDIKYENNQTLLQLNYKLPKNIKNGEFCVEKWQLFLTAPYSGANKINASYKILKDFTPYLNIPLMAKNSPSYSIIFNEAMRKIDEKIHEIEKRLDI